MAKKIVAHDGATGQVGASQLERVLALLGKSQKSGSGWKTRCPAHDDRNPSLSVTIARSGWVRLRCFASCTEDAILRKLGLRQSDLGPPREPKADIVGVYDYRDAHGVVAYQVVRFRPKTFKQRRPDGRGGYVWNLNGVQRVLYRLPELLAADPSDLVFLVEGEKDADALAKLELVTTTTAMGATHLAKTDLTPLSGRAIIVLPDNDEQGEKYAKDAVRLLGARVLRLPNLPPKGDVSDWLAAGGTRDDLLALVAALQEHEAAPATNAMFVRASDVQMRPVSWLWEGRIPLGMVTVLVGQGGLGKSTLTIELAARLSRGQLAGAFYKTPVTSVVASAEDVAECVIKPRLVAAGADVDRVLLVKDTLTLPDDLEQLEAALLESGAKLVVVDPLVAFLTDRKSSWNEQHVRRILAPLSAMAERLGVAIVAVMHFKKGDAGDVLGKINGSLAFGHAARSVLAFGHDPDDPDGEMGSQRVLAQAKINVGRNSATLRFRIVGEDVNGIDASRLAWLGESDATAGEILDELQRHELEAAPNAEQWLRQQLEAGPVLLADLAGSFTTKQLRTAASKLHVKKEKTGFRGGWVWSLPQTTNTSYVREEGIFEGTTTRIANDSNEDPQDALGIEQRASSDAEGIFGVPIEDAQGAQDAQHARTTNDDAGAAPPADSIQVGGCTIAVTSTFGPVTSDHLVVVPARDGVRGAA